MPDLDPSTPPPPTVVAPAPSPRAKTAIVFGLFLGVLIFGLDGLIVATALPTIAASLGQADGVAFVVSAYLISVTIAAPIFGRLSDLASRKTVFLTGVLVFLGGSVLAGLSQNLGELILFRGVQGFGAGAFLPVALAIVADLFPPAERARITGGLTGAAGIAVVVGPLLGSYILDATSTWRWVFYINLPIGLLSLALIAVFLGPMRASEPGRFDTIGAGLLAGWVAALIFPLVEISDAGWGWTDLRALALFAAALAMFVAFLRWELTTAEPLIALRQFGRRTLAMLGGIVLLNSVVLTAVSTFLSIFVGVVLLHDGPNATNDVRDILYWVAIPIVLGAVLAGQLLTRLPYRVVLAPALAIALLGAYLLSLANAQTPLWTLADGFLPVGGLALALIPLGFGTGLVLSGCLVIVQNEWPAKEIGAGVAVFTFLRNLGGAVGVSLLAAFEQWRYGELLPAHPSPAGIETALVRSYQAVFLAMFALTAAALLCALFISGRLARTAPAPAASPPGTEPGGALASGEVAAVPAAGGGPG